MNGFYKFADDMDAAGMEEARPALEQLVDGVGDVTLDMSAVTFMDSSGVGGLVFLFKRLRASGRRLLLTGVRGQPQQLLTHLGMSDLLGIAPLRRSA